MLKIITAWVVTAFSLIGGFTLAVTAIQWRSPYFAGRHTIAMAIFFVVAAVVILAGIYAWRRKTAAGRPLIHPVGRILASLIAIGAAVSTLVTEARFHWIRYSVINADPALVSTFGRHFIVGYRDIAEARKLAARGAVGGFFITAHNVSGKSIKQVRQEISTLQTLADRRLWIASDQEGGGVSRLSPPLPFAPYLSSVAREHANKDKREAAVREYAIAQGIGLKSLGVNVNFAPVVDLDHQVVNPDDRHTRITERAISPDFTLVAEVARTYCRALRTADVICTLKHFPGIGRVYNDTHVQSADLSTPRNILSNSDWVPFRSVSAQTPPPFIMLSHVRMPSFDSENPTSFSREIVTGLLRGNWQFEGILITDDFSMRSVYDSPAGIGGAAVKAMNAGVDLILVSYDPSQYYRAMHGLLQAHANGTLDERTLARSHERLRLSFGSLEPQHRITRPD